MPGRNPQLGWRLPVKQTLVLAGERIPFPQEIRGQIFLSQGLLRATSYTGQVGGGGSPAVGRASPVPCAGPQLTLELGLPSTAPCILRGVAGPAGAAQT